LRQTNTPSGLQPGVIQPHGPVKSEQEQVQVLGQSAAVLHWFPGPPHCWPLWAQPFAQQLAPHLVSPGLQVQNPFTQFSFTPQLMQAWPEAPQALGFDVPLIQVPPWQQLPAGHGCWALHGCTQTPP
jgi:hypothetical protein